MSIGSSFYHHPYHHLSVHDVPRTLYGCPTVKSHPLISLQQGANSNVLFFPNIRSSKPHQV
uniref:Uncharacterized protein n=1 Tax=Rhizophora mucronata TaxID=61149 RepID=A0A2P2MGZ4_RHIMU